MVSENTGIDFIDRRRFPRFNVHYLADVYMGDRNIYATVIDISQNGLGIILPEPFYVGDELELRIRCKIADDDDTKTDIRLGTKVIWIGEKNEKGMYAGGLEIVEISDSDKEVLKANIQELAQEQQ